MARKKTRAIPERDLSLRPAGEVLQRLLLLGYALAGAGGFVALGLGVAKHRPPLAIAGTLGLAIALALHVTRARWGAPKVMGELKTNPFKPRRVSREDDEDGT